eukprot:CAMPEP_0184973470 /NCGR_PEP_ID=MMETSP1098-20130426/5234_1 /TAXON_ID=89044 /ORGANISM="Spumella elongata, Strain CCAP 955/1" /LENGTH=133 /DNA_ID=CAMNT_0027495925 /DNA_START=22 /DNA_END=423 /DNA_ORIENTATION=-
MTGRINPFALIQVSSLDSSDTEYAKSPRSQFVGTCMNCNFTFRLASSFSTDFCTKDCQTCYLIYVSNPAHTPKKFKAEKKSAKQLVYEFQREVERQDSARNSDDENKTAMRDARSSPVKIVPAQRGWTGMAQM